MGLLGKLKGKRDDDDDLDGLDEESFDDDDGPSTGLLGRMRQKLRRSRAADDAGADDPGGPLRPALSCGMRGRVRTSSRL